MQQQTDPMARSGAATTKDTPGEDSLWSNLPPAPNLVYGGRAPFRKGSDTSRAAARSMAGADKTLRTRALAFIRDQGDAGATHAEVCTFLEVERQTGGPRVTELAKGGFVADSGRRRVMSSGRSGKVVVATAKEGDGSICEAVAAVANDAAA